LGEAPLEDDGEDPARAGEVAFPELVAGTRWQRRVQDQLDLGAFGQPAGERQVGLLDGPEAQRQRLHAA